MAVAAVAAEDDIPVEDVAQDPDSVGFLSQVGMGSAVENTLGEVLQNGLLKTTDTVNGLV